MNIEKLTRHIEHLQKQHDDLDKIIQDEYNRYQDDRLVLHLKKQKLALKDEIEKFKKDLNEI
jgi:hypothetical protein